MTQQGEVFYRHAQRVLKAIAETALAVQGSAAQAAGRVSLGLPQSTAEQYAMPLLQALREHHPAIELEVFDEISGYLLRSLLQGRLDMAVIVSDEDAQLLASQALFDEELFLVSRSDMAPRKKAIDMKAMCALPLALPGMAHGVRARVELAVRQAALILPTPVVQANSMRVMRRAVLQGLAHAIMPWAAVAEELQEGRMQITPLKPRLSRRVYLCTAPDSELSLAGQVVHALLRDHCLEDVRSGRWQGAALI
jgi:LysR family transcriptional regulator, nitrogen assimilation regulatory protein